MAIHMIRRFVQFWPDETIFTTRDCLAFGMRAAVDKALARLVYRQEIIRLARGVFVKARNCRKAFSDWEIANAKSKAFGRTLIESPLVIAERLSPEVGNRVSAVEFCTEGHSSHFQIGERTIYFKKTGQRKLQLAKCKAGEAARALWNIGSSRADIFAYEKAVAQFNRLDKIEFCLNIRWMPAWLGDQIKIRRWDRDYENRETNPALKYVLSSAPDG
jgi:hypothetical protein